MPVYDGHDTDCEQTWHRNCQCRCAGLCHGWPGALAVARHGSDSRLAQWRRATLEASEGQAAVPWTKTANRSIGQNRRPVIDETRIELALRIHEVIGTELAARGFSAEVRRSDVILQRVWHLARGIQRDVLPLLVGLYRQATGEEDPALRKRLAGTHWWCELIAWTTGWLGEEREVKHPAPRELARQLGQLRTEGDECDEPLAPEIVRVAVDGVWEKVGGLEHIGRPLGFERALLALRMLGTFMCKAPEHHRTVIHSCLWPLARHLPEDWCRRLQSSFPE